MKRVIALALASATGSAFADGLLVNGGAEAGDLSGWTLDATQIPAGNQIFAAVQNALSDDSLPPIDGAFVFEFDAVSTGAPLNSGVIARMHQAVAVSPGDPLRFAGAIATSGPPSCDPGRASLIFRDAQGDPVGQVIDTGFDVSPDEWAVFVFDVNAPSQAETAEVILEGRLDCGTFIDTFFDSVTLSLAACSCADFVPPFDVVDLADIDAFVTAFLVNDPAADLVPPQGIIDLADVDAFITSYLAGCP